MRLLVVRQSRWKCRVDVVISFFARLLLPLIRSEKLRFRQKMRGWVAHILGIYVLPLFVKYGSEPQLTSPATPINDTRTNQV